MKMKNKKAEQAARKQKHKEALKGKRRQAPDLKRNAPAKEEKPTILIVCEGENTEPSYFRQFRLSNAIVKPIGEGYNTLSLVKRAGELADEKPYDQVWCVFDKDSFDDFNEAISTAKTKGYRVAYSNQAFEYWIILHFDDHQGGGMDRKDYDKKINDLLKPFGIEYDGEGCKTVTPELFTLLEGTDARTKKSRQLLAIARAKRNHDQFDHKNPASQESSTTVFELVEELLKYV